MRMNPVTARSTYKRLMRQSRTHPLARPKDPQLEDIDSKPEVVISQPEML
jgi:hypothetical protein